MNFEDIKKLIQEDENENVEFKRSTARLKEAMQSLCAFLNGNGGFVIIGVEPNRKIVGQEISDKTKRDIFEFIIQMKPRCDAKTEYIPIPNLPNKYLIVFMAHPEEKHKPYMFNSISYHRIQSSTRKMPQDIQEELYLKRNGYFKNWERFPATLQGFQYLDFDTIRRAVLDSNLKISEEDQDIFIEKALRYFDLFTDDGQLTNAALVLFGKKLGVYYPQCLLKLAIFKGNDKLSGFIENKQEYLNCFQALERTEKFFEMFLPKSGTLIPGSFRRKDEYPVPLAALREAMINALAHRDYSSRSGSISVAIYDDRLEITNTGILPKEISLADLEKEHQSRPRNRLLANTFHQCGLIEKWGTGTLNILSFCREAGLLKPLFEEHTGAFYVIFRFNENIMGRKTTLQKPIKEHQDLNKTSREILIAIQNLSGEATTPELCNILGISKRTLQRYLSSLKKSGLLEQVGSGKNTAWRIVKTY